MQLRSLFIVIGLVAAVGVGEAVPSRAEQGGPVAQAGSTPPTGPPATKIEGFRPAAGSVVTFGYDELGSVNGISVDVRELRDAKGATVRGLLVEVTESEYRKERSFVDADEVPELLKGIDALLEVKENPTAFENFEVRYTTRGDLQLTAFSSTRDTIMFAVQVGRTIKAQSIGLGINEMKYVRTMFEAAQKKLGTFGGK